MTVVDSKLKCSVLGCGRVCYARGWCSRHYQRWWTYGDPIGRPESHHPKPCSIPECNRRSKAKGWCTLHYRRWKSTGDPMGLKQRPYGLTKVEVVSYELRRATRDGDCWMPSCYIQQPQGYSLVNFRGKKGSLHRLSLEVRLGRELKETVSNPSGPCLSGVTMERITK